MVLQNIGGVTTYPWSLDYQRINVPDANGTMYVMEGTLTEQIAAWDGSIIGFTGTLSTALTTGSLVFQPTINGSLCPAFPDAASIRTNQTKSRFVQAGRQSFYQFVAGDALGVMWQKTGTVNPTTADLQAQLIILYEEVRF